MRCATACSSATRQPIRKGSCARTANGQLPRAVSDRCPSRRRRRAVARTPRPHVGRRARDPRQQRLESCAGPPVPRVGKADLADPAPPGWVNQPMRRRNDVPRTVVLSTPVLGVYASASSARSTERTSISLGGESTCRVWARPWTEGSFGSRASRPRPPSAAAADRHLHSAHAAPNLRVDPGRVEPPAETGDVPHRAHQPDIDHARLPSRSWTWAMPAWRPSRRSSAAR
jgi:hypothetical protein